jgi:ABC-type phosphate transport system permease subunit
MIGIPSAEVSIRYVFGGSPNASDLARYPMLLVPIVLGLGTYGVLVATLVGRGLSQLQTPMKDGTPGWIVLTRAFQMPVQPPAVAQSGLLNNVIGTVELVVLTLVIAVPIGVGVGVFVSEVAPGNLGRLVRFSTTALRGISVVLLALAGASLVAASRGTQLERIIGGYFIDIAGVERMGPTFSRGSYVPAAIVTALLVIPVVAGATEESCRSLPRGIREGSAALGATQDYTLIRLIIPWALPNVLTAVLLGAAEAAGGVSTLLFIAGSGEQGVSPFSEVTNLAFVVFWTQFSPFKPFRDLQQPYGFAAAGLLLLLALTFTILSLSVKIRYASRYRGG